MISFLRARVSQDEHGANSAVVCSIPPSEVGFGITACAGTERRESGLLGRESGRKYMYIWVVNLFGILVGVIHLVNGINDSVSKTPPRASTTCDIVVLPLYMSFLALSRSCSGISNNSPLPSFRFASRMPLSSKHSLIAPILYAEPSSCRFGEEGGGISPSWLDERLPPGNTCADGKALEVCTRWRRRIWLVGEMRSMLALGLGSTGTFFGFPVEEDMYCF